MIKVEIHKVIPQPRPAELVTITMDREAAEELNYVMRFMGLSPLCAIEGPCCPLIPEDLRKIDTRFGGHPYRYKRVIDAISKALSQVLDKR